MWYAQKEADHGDGGGGADPAFAHAMAEFDVAGQAEDVRASPLSSIVFSPFSVDLLSSF